MRAILPVPRCCPGCLRHRPRPREEDGEEGLLLLRSNRPCQALCMTRIISRTPIERNISSRRGRKIQSRLLQISIVSILTTSQCMNRRKVSVQTGELHGGMYIFDWLYFWAVRLTDWLRRSTIRIHGGDIDITAHGDNPNRKDSEKLAALCAMYQLDGQGVVCATSAAMIPLEMLTAIAYIVVKSGPAEKCLQEGRRIPALRGQTVRWQRCRLRASS